MEPSHDWLLQTPPQAETPEPEPPPVSALAWTSLVLGLLAPVTMGLTAIPGICCAAIGLRYQKQQRGFAMVGLVLSVLSLVLPVLAYRQLRTLGLGVPEPGIVARHGVMDTAGQTGLPPVPASATQVQAGRELNTHQTVNYLRFAASAADCQGYVDQLEVRFRQAVTRPLFRNHTTLPAWFDVQKVNAGWSYRVSLATRMTAMVVYDTKKHVIYVFWFSET